MAKFIEITSTSGEWFLVNENQINCLGIERHPYEHGTYVHFIDMTGRLISVTGQMFNSVKSKLPKYGD